MITIKVQVCETPKKNQKLALSFSRQGACIVDVIESLSELYPDIKSIFYNDAGMLSGLLIPASCDGKTLEYDTLLTEGMEVKLPGRIPAGNGSTKP